ncbi:CD160 antigen [Apodemus sylvaticus]|uniref:CD160 antigen n=1 Tax=Apodemus sylvaticus TaxID=10129 RepID=UPI0022433325|nr:CD160 antigen [Apodemus sylvaticus]
MKGRAVTEVGRQAVNKSRRPSLGTQNTISVSPSLTARKNFCPEGCTGRDHQSQPLREIPGAANNTQILMAPGQSCWALAVLLAIVNFQHGGCIHVTSSASQKGGRLDFTCTLWHKKGEADGLILFWCKDRSWNCSPETSLKQLMIRRDPGTDDITEMSSQLVLTIEQATPSDSGTYQCCARSRKPEIYIHGHFLSVQVPGNHTEMSQRQRSHPDFSHINGTLSSGFLQVKAWGMLVTSLVAFQVL